MREAVTFMMLPAREHRLDALGHCRWARLLPFFEGRKLLEMQKDTPFAGGLHIPNRAHLPHCLSAVAHAFVRDSLRLREKRGVGGHRHHHRSMTSANVSAHRAIHHKRPRACFFVAARWGGFFPCMLVFFFAELRLSDACPILYARACHVCTS